VPVPKFLEKQKSSVPRIKINNNERFEQLMSKDWQNEFKIVNKNMNNLNKRHRLIKQISKDPAAYFATHSQKTNEPQMTKPKVQFSLPVIY
jgi:hypothetical protein